MSATDTAPATDQAEPAPDRDASAHVPPPDVPPEPDPEGSGSGDPSSPAGSASGSTSGGGTTTKKASGKKRGKRGGRKSLQRDLEQLLGVLGSGLSMLDPFDGTVVLENAPQLARALDDAAKENEALWRTLAMLTSGSGGAAGIALALVPIVLPIAKHHGLLPDTPAVTDLADGMTPDSARVVAETMRTGPGQGASPVETLIGRDTPGPGVEG